MADDTIKIIRGLFVWEKLNAMSFPAAKFQCWWLAQLNIDIRLIRNSSTPRKLHFCSCPTEPTWCFLSTANAEAIIHAFVHLPHVTQRQEQGNGVQAAHDQAHSLSLRCCTNLEWKPRTPRSSQHCSQPSEHIQTIFARLTDKTSRPFRIQLSIDSLFSLYEIGPQTAATRLSVMKQEKKKA